MKIVNIDIYNYRNLDGAKIRFDENCNFIVGENNLGKSNLLSLINTVFTARSFKPEDFRNINLPIQVNFTLKLAPIEIGHFQDLFDLEDYTLINIAATQDTSDDYISFKQLETDIAIQPSAIRCVNYIHYDSLRNPITEINFDKGRGVGKFLKNIISQYLETNGIAAVDYLDESKIQTLLNSINNKINKIKSFQDFGINASIESDTESLLSRVVVLKDSKGDSFMRTGYGVQFLILVTLSVLDKIQSIRTQRAERGIFEDELLGTKTISLIIGLDEPEIHLHPYMQRSLIKFLNSIISNTNSNFQALIRELFQIDEFTGQILVVSHSPSILLNDYKQIVRFSQKNDGTQIISGVNTNLNQQLQKHLHLHFPFIKEAFFSRCVIFVEGDSEYASFPHFGESLSINFDDLGICIIQARGNAIHQLLEVASAFGIQSIGVTDRDDRLDPPLLSNHFQTARRDFESEIANLLESGHESFLRTILCAYDSLGEERELSTNSLNKRAYNTYRISSSPFNTPLKLSNIESSDIQLLKAFYLTWFSINKSHPLGTIIGKLLPEYLIPEVYKNAINKAKQLATNA